MFDPLTLERPIAGRYRALRELGRGGMGAVYLVEHVHTGDHLALKVLLAHVGSTPAAVERFKREARTSALIKSENVVKITDADVAPELGDAPFLVMELLNGADFDKLVAEHGPLSAELTVTYLYQAARAIDRAHQLGIVHRDLKPENLFLHTREDGVSVVKVLDFGISKMLDPTGGMASASMTQTGAVMGTPLFMSPEQAQGDAGVGPATDIWALGLIAIFMLTGESYWRSGTLSQLILDIVVSPMTPISERFPGRFASALDAWFARSCDRKAALRFSSMREQVAALAAALGVQDAALLRLTPPSFESLSSITGLTRPQIGRVSTTENPLSLSLAGTPVARPAQRRGLWLAAGAASLCIALGLLAWQLSTPRNANLNSSASAAPALEKERPNAATPPPRAPAPVEVASSPPAPPDDASQAPASRASPEPATSSVPARGVRAGKARSALKQIPAIPHGNEPPAAPTPPAAPAVRAAPEASAPKAKPFSPMAP